MPRFKPYDYRQSLMVPLTLEEQLPPGSLEYALHHLIEERIEESWFDDLYANEEFGRPAYSPKLLLKVILLGYARGLLGSRRLERACKENITFMAISCGLRPDHSTLAAFVDKLQGRIEVIFSEVLLVCHEEGLLSGTHLSLDGLKLPGNASREWSGTFQELRLKAAKLQRKLSEKVAEHRRQDRLDKKRAAGDDRSREKAARQASLQRLRQKAERVGAFLKEAEPKQGARGNEVQSNVTDNESAKMQTSHGVVQGYNAQALVDEKHQVIVHGLPSGSGQDHRQVGPMLAGAREMLELSGLSEELPLEKAKLTADCNYHSEENLTACEEHRVDAYIPDNHFRQRDPRFATQERHKSDHRAKKGCFGLKDFTYDARRDCYVCPQGQELTCQSASHATGDGHRYRRYRAKARDCAACPLRSRCIARGGARKSLAIPLGEEPATRTARMRQKIDTAPARAIYGRRLAIVEPVFANLRSNKRLDRFTYRGQAKVGVQWLLYCLVHNLEKLAHLSRKYGPQGSRRGRWCLLTRLRRVLECLSRLLTSLHDFAQAPTRFSYQAKLTLSS